MSTKLVRGPRLIRGDERADAEALAQMQESIANRIGTQWVAYQNQDLGHPHLGHLRFLAVGPRNTLDEAPERHPDVKEGVMWRYIKVGVVNLKTGEITSS